MWSAVAILHVVGTLSLLLSCSAMFFKSRNDLLAVDQKAREIESAFQSAAEDGLDMNRGGAGDIDRLGNIDMASFSKMEPNLQEPKPPTYQHVNI